MAGSARTFDDLLTRAALLSFPRRFRNRLGSDLVALYADFDSGGRSRGRVAVAWELLRNGLGARLDDFRRGLGGGRVPGPDGRSPRGLGAWLGDVVFGARVLRRSPGFTLVAVASLAIGIGANTAVFTVLDATVLRTLPVRAPEELAVLHVAGARDDWPDVSTSGWMLENDAGHSETSSFSFPFYQRLAASDAPLTSVTAFARLYRVNVRVGERAEITAGQVAAGNYHEFLGVRPWRGRLLVPSDDDPAAPPVAVVSHDFWQARLGGADDAVGREISINGAPFTVVGVTPPGFHGALQLGDSTPITVPLAHQAPVMRGRELLARGDYWWLHVMGRLRPGADLEQVRAAADLVLANSLEADLDGSPGVIYTLALPGGQGMTEARSLVIEPLTTLVVVVVAVLLIACVNLANLLVARASNRAREIAVRRSLGASRGRVVRQLLTESLMLAGVGAVAGAVLARGLYGLLLPVLELQGAEIGLGLNLRVLGFTALAAAVTGLLFGIVPALRASGADLTPALKDEPLRGGRRRLGLARVLLVAQVALSLGLLVVAGLFAGSLAELAGEATGFDGEGVLTVSVDPRLSGYSGEDLGRYYDEALRRLRRVGGATAVGIASHVPVSGTMTNTSISVEGYEPAEGERIGTYLNVVDDGFFEVFRMTATRGRLFEPTDDVATTPVAVVNQLFVERYLPGLNPLGRRVTFGSGDGALHFEIVGVVPAVKYQNLSDRPWEAVHLLYRQIPEELGSMTFALRAAVAPLDLAASARAALRDLDADVSISELAAHPELVRRNVAGQRTFAQLSAALSAVALLLSCIGLYGILSYSVARRTREIGVRMALGARAADVTRLIMREMGTVALGAVLGLVAALFAVRGLESQLYGLEPNDPRVLGVAVVLLLTVAALAALLPARRAARLDPVEALRTE